MIKSFIRTENSGFLWFHRLLDLMIPFVMLLSILKFMDITWHDKYTYISTLGGFVFVTASQFVGIYNSWRGRSLFNSTQLILKAWLLTWTFLIVLAFLYKDSENFSRLSMSLWAITTPFFFILYRVLVRVALSRYRKFRNSFRTIAIAGAGKLGRNVAQTINQNPWMGLKVIAFYDDNKTLHGTKIQDIPVINDLNGLFSDARNKQFSEIYLCLPMGAEKTIKNLLEKLSDTTAIVKYIPDLFSFDLMHTKWTDLKGIPVISVFDSPLNSSTARFIKRLEDIIVSLAIIVLISPILILISILVKTTSAGPIIFKQKRYGLNGEQITIYKFRSMYCLENGDEIHQATQEDPRVTKLGAFLRKMSLDELPQFINVLQGNMSIVGPRPHAVAHNEKYRTLIKKYMQRHIVKPGITGWAQINGLRGETQTIEQMEQRVEFDLHYIKTWSLWLDIKIVILTLFKGFIHKNAY
jgi:putative colanic acid biosynthesis UDP-glucose lipid carrier transferase